jgi:hypothetical protein
MDTEHRERRRVETVKCDLCGEMILASNNGLWYHQDMDCLGREIECTNKHRGCTVSSFPQNTDASRSRLR